MKITKKTFQYGLHTVTLETGSIARQATGSVLVSIGDTVVLATVVVDKAASTKKDFFPLTVNYQERYYSSGKLPGGFIKREGRPSNREVLTSRLIDRAIRPLFQPWFRNEIQIIITVISMDQEIQPDIPSMIGASAALMISGVPFDGPLAAARVGYKDGEFLLNPNLSQIKTSQIDLIVAGTEKAIMMVESEIKELPEDIVLNAVAYGQEKMQEAILAIKEFTEEGGKAAISVTHTPIDQNLTNEVTNFVEPLLKEALGTFDKKIRQPKINEIVDQAIGKFSNPEDALCSAVIANIKEICDNVSTKIVRERILNDQVRIDGRDTKTIRPIDINLSPFPRTHGSAIFTRGETQALVITTLGTENDAQIIDTPSEETSERFMLHYNFAPYCTGEISMLASPKRREIGHGNLAKRALQAVIPGKDSFPYVVRVVSEITESNGSSSMASVCGATLSLMDAGVPITAPVAGIAMGLIKEGDRYVVLTDILGDEDHFGDMDFKVAGTASGITALQMDIKIQGVSKDIMEKALQQAKEARLFILDLIIEKISKPREHVSDFAPHILTMQISQDKIRDVIGKGGVTIRSIVEETGAEIDISDKGLITIASVNKLAGQAALDRITSITAEAEVGKIYKGKIVKLMDFGAFVNILPGKDGLVHISQIVDAHVNRVEDYLQEGQEVNVKVMEIDRQGKIRLSIKEAEAELSGSEATTSSEQS